MERCDLEQSQMSSELAHVYRERQDYSVFEQSNPSINEDVN